MFGALLQNVQLIVIYLTTPHNWKLCIAATLDSSFAAGLLLLVSLGLPYLFCCCLLDFSIDPEFAAGSLGLLLSLGLVQLIIILVHKHPHPMIGRCTCPTHVVLFILLLRCLFHFTSPLVLLGLLEVCIFLILLLR